MAEDRNIVTIDDVEYVYEDLPEDVRNILAELSYVREEIQNHNVEVQRLEMMQRGYGAELAEQMKKVQQ